MARKANHNELVNFYVNTSPCYIKYSYLYNCDILMGTPIYDIDDITYDIDDILIDSEFGYDYNITELDDYGIDLLGYYNLHSMFLYNYQCPGDNYTCTLSKTDTICIKYKDNTSDTIKVNYKPIPTYIIKKEYGSYRFDTFYILDPSNVALEEMITHMNTNSLYVPEDKQSSYHLTHGYYMYWFIHPEVGFLKIDLPNGGRRMRYLPDTIVVHIDPTGYDGDYLSYAYEVTKKDLPEYLIYTGSTAKQWNYGI